VKNNPIVTIACLTYNHGPYIRKAIDSFLAQKTEYDFEIVVHDDASTDDTVTILQEYKSRYPDIIRLVLRDSNQYSLGVSKMFYHGIIKGAHSKYIATCEGDDYWIDDMKLQKQISFLEDNPDYTFSVGSIRQLDDKSGVITDVKERFEIDSKQYFTVKDYLKYFFSQTSTYVFRREGYVMPSYCNRFHGEDILLVVLGTGSGKIKYHEDIFSVYRKHAGGVTSKEFNWRMHYLDIVNYTEALREIVGRKYSLVFLSIRARLFVDYKLKTTKTPLGRKIYRIMGAINNRLRWKLL